MYEKKRTSGWVVLLSFIIFFPLGFFFLHRRLTEDKTESLRNSKIVKIFAWTLISLFIFYLIALITTDNKEEGLLLVFVLSFLLFMAPGLRLLYGAKKMKEQGMRYNRYRHIVNSGVTSIPEIARAVAVPEKVVLTELQEILDYGFFPGAYLDLSCREIIMPGRHNRNVNNVHININHNTISEKRQKNISCPNCGAKTVVTEGIITKCEYCDSPLTY